mmetsp:Transcript_17293/g.50257  ORF Transcript_17293/g.50257 Transcript_17293/m.50257 type:complete len:292 (-) Transcript_17293:157-1032(-)
MLVHVPVVFVATAAGTVGFRSDAAPAVGVAPHARLGAPSPSAHLAPLDRRSSFASGPGPGPGGDATSPRIVPRRPFHLPQKGLPIDLTLPSPHGPRVGSTKIPMIAVAVRKAQVPLEGRPSPLPILVSQGVDLGLQLSSVGPLLPQCPMKIEIERNVIRVVIVPYGRDTSARTVPSGTYEFAIGRGTIAGLPRNGEGASFLGGGDEGRTTFHRVENVVPIEDVRTEGIGPGDLVGDVVLGFHHGHPGEESTVAIITALAVLHSIPPFVRLGPDIVGIQAETQRPLLPTPTE